jgi:DNA-directed RNA polymerase subunit N (RpoN/RPB10)|tara:strand:- start:2885 stop:3079 length:195 start_codon:yes stop_codon:yes gene_type:complete
MLDPKLETKYFAPKLKKDYEFFAKQLKAFEKKKKITPGLGWAKMLCRQRMTEIEMVLEPLGFEV